MLDRYTVSLISKPLNIMAQGLDRLNTTPNQVTGVGFIIGMTAIPLLSQQLYLLALGVILLNRLGDGLDGALARIQGSSDFGGFLDIVCDFIFYSGVIFGFALASPEQNALYATMLIFTFIGTSCSFLAFAIMATKKNIQHTVYPYKSFYYLGGITEGTETIAFFILFCLYPDWFPIIATIFSALCLITIIMRFFAAKYTFDH